MNDGRFPPKDEEYLIRRYTYCIRGEPTSPFWETRDRPLDGPNLEHQSFIPRGKTGNGNPECNGVVQ